MSQEEQWRVQLWLGEYLIEERIAPTGLAEQYANVIRLRIRGLTGRRLHCERVSVDEVPPTYARQPNPHDRLLFGRTGPAPPPPGSD